MMQLPVISAGVILEKAWTVRALFFNRSMRGSTYIEPVGLEDSCRLVGFSRFFCFKL